jgi:hypothetical protein
MNPVPPCLLPLPANLRVPHRLDYPGVGPEHSFLQEMGRAEYHAVTGVGRMLAHARREAWLFWGWWCSCLGAFEPNGIALTLTCSSHL